MTRDDLTDKRFGHLTVVRECGSQTYPCGQKKAVWECICDCGNKTIVTGADLRAGRSNSCGCYGSRHMKATMTHGETNTRLYAIWFGMKYSTLRSRVVCGHWDFVKAISEPVHSNNRGG